MVVRADSETFPAKAGRSPRVYLVLFADDRLQMTLCKVVIDNNTRFTRGERPALAGNVSNSA